MAEAAAAAAEAEVAAEFSGDGGSDAAAAAELIRQASAVSRRSLEQAARSRAGSAGSYHSAEADAAALAAERLLLPESGIVHRTDSAGSRASLSQTRQSLAATRVSVNATARAALGEQHIIELQEPSEAEAPVRAELERCREQLAEKEQEVVVLRARCESLERLLEEKGQTGDARSRQYQEELQKRGKRIKELEQELAKMRAAQATQSSDDKLVQLRDEIKSMKRQNTVLEKDLASWKQKEHALRTEATKARHLTAPPQMGGLQVSPTGSPRSRQRSASPCPGVSFAAEGIRFEQSFAFPPPQRSDASAPPPIRNTQLLEEAKDCISGLRKKLADTEAELERTKRKLGEAHTAIMTNVDGISQLDGKLQQSRKALRWMLKQQASSAAQSRSVSPIPCGSRTASPGRLSSPPRVPPQTERDQLYAAVAGLNAAARRASPGRASYADPLRAPSPQQPPAPAYTPGVWAAPPPSYVGSGTAAHRSRSADTSLTNTQLSALRDLEHLLRRSAE